ncbi:MAG: hypothetical protein ACOCWC_01395 [Bacteroidota bacterium]
MKVSVELSLYPLTKEFIPEIIDFVNRLKQHPDIIVEVNDMSTQVFGEYKKVMTHLTSEIEQSFKEKSKAAIVMKILNVGLRN